MQRQKYANLIIPPHIQNQLLNLMAIQAFPPFYCPVPLALK
jgi:hypothetical protein